MVAFVAEREVFRPERRGLPARNVLFRAERRRLPEKNSDFRAEKGSWQREKRRNVRRTGFSGGKSRIPTGIRDFSRRERPFRTEKQFCQPRNRNSARNGGHAGCRVLVLERKRGGAGGGTAIRAENGVVRVAQPAIRTESRWCRQKRKQFNRKSRAAGGKTPSRRGNRVLPVANSRFLDGMIVVQGAGSGVPDGMRVVPVAGPVFRKEW